MNYHFEDFTENEYRCLLTLAKTSWRMIAFDDYQMSGKTCLWRHDVDFSIHRAYRLAQIEAEEGVRATYFILLHSEFYNVLERDITRLIKAIRAMGHELGLHFDPNFYVDCAQRGDALADRLGFERDILRSIFDTDIRVFSLHNPTMGEWTDELTADELAGMVNAYGQSIKQNYEYCSDSNGYWRFERLSDVVRRASDEKLHVLTHPEWWTPEPMSPRDRVSRCINGRATRQHQRYDQFLVKAGRENVR